MFDVHLDILEGRRVPKDQKYFELWIALLVWKVVPLPCKP